MTKQSAANNKFLATIKPAIATGMYKWCIELVNYGQQDRAIEYLFDNFSDVTVWGWLFAAQDWSEFQRAWHQMIYAMTNELIEDNYSYPASTTNGKYSRLGKFRAEVVARKLLFAGKWNGKDRMRILEWTLANEEMVEGTHYTIEREQALQPAPIADAAPASDSGEAPVTLSDAQNNALKKIALASKDKKQDVNGFVFVWSAWRIRITTLEILAKLDLIEYGRKTTFGHEHEDTSYVRFTDAGREYATSRGWLAQPASSTHASAETVDMDGTPVKLGVQPTPDDYRIHKGTMADFFEGRKSTDKPASAETGAGDAEATPIDVAMDALVQCVTEQYYTSSRRELAINANAALDVVALHLDAQSKELAAMRARVEALEAERNAMREVLEALANPPQKINRFTGKPMASVLEDMDYSHIARETLKKLNTNK